MSAISFSASSNVSTGITGPNISSPITASARVTPSITVGSMRSASSSRPPPYTTLVSSISPQILS